MPIFWLRDSSEILIFTKDNLNLFFNLLLLFKIKQFSNKKCLWSDHIEHRDFSTNCLSMDCELFFNILASVVICSSPRIHYSYCYLLKKKDGCSGEKLGSNAYYSRDFDNVIDLIHSINDLMISSQTMNFKSLVITNVDEIITTSVMIPHPTSSFPPQQRDLKIWELEKEDLRRTDIAMTNIIQDYFYGNAKNVYLQLGYINVTNCDMKSLC